MNVLNHPRILAGPRAGLVPLVDWLTDARTAEREVPVRTSFKIGRDVAEALVCLHLVGASAGRVDLTSIHVDAAGTEAFLCPVETSAKAADGSSEHRKAHVADLAQLGQVLFELCCRRALRPGEDLKHLRSGFALVSLTNPKVPVAGDALIAALLAPARGQRHERAKPVLDELRRIVNELDRGAEPVVAAPPAADTRSILGRKIQDLLSGWAPESAPAAPSAAPRVAAPATSRVAYGMMAALLLLKVFAPVPDAVAAAPRAPVASARASHARPAADKAELTRRIIALQGELRRAR